MRRIYTSSQHVDVVQVCVCACVCIMCVHTVQYVCVLCACICMCVVCVHMYSYIYIHVNCTLNAPLTELYTRYTSSTPHQPSTLSLYNHTKDIDTINTKR